MGEPSRRAQHRQLDPVPGHHRELGNRLPPAVAGHLHPHGSVHAELSGERFFLTFPMMRPAPVRQLWASVPDTRSLGTPTTIPVLLGAATPAAILGALRARTAVARWPAGHRVLSVLATHPSGAPLRVLYPR